MVACRAADERLKVEEVLDVDGGCCEAWCSSSFAEQVHGGPSQERFTRRPGLMSSQLIQSYRLCYSRYFSPTSAEILRMDVWTRIEDIKVLKSSSIVLKERTRLNDDNP